MRKIINSSLNILCLFALISSFTVCIVEHNLMGAFSWLSTFCFFIACYSMERTRDIQHEIIKGQELQIKGLEAEIEILRKGN